MPKGTKEVKTPDTQSTEISDDTQTSQNGSDVAEPAVDPLDEQAAQLVSGMSLEDKVAQMFVITPEALTGYTSVTAAGDTTKQHMKQTGRRSDLYGRQSSQYRTDDRNAYQYAEHCNGADGTAAFLSVDEEGGTVARVAANEAFGVTNVGNMSDIGAAGDAQKAYDAGVTIGTYLKQLGFNVDYAPVADVLTNPGNTAIGTRSFGSDASMVADMVTKELEGLSSQGVFRRSKTFSRSGRCLRGFP